MHLATRNGDVLISLGFSSLYRAFDGSLGLASALHPFTVTMRATLTALLLTTVMSAPLAQGVNAQDHATEALLLCEQAERLPAEQKAAAFEQGLALAEEAVGADSDNARAHFAVFCHLGKRMQLDGLTIRTIRGLEPAAAGNRCDARARALLSRCADREGRPPSEPAVVPGRRSRRGRAPPRPRPRDRPRERPGTALSGTGPGGARCARRGSRRCPEGALRRRARRQARAGRRGAASPRRARVTLASGRQLSSKRRGCSPFTCPMNGGWML